MTTATRPRSPKPDFLSRADWSAGHHPPWRSPRRKADDAPPNSPYAQFSPEFAMSQSPYSAPLADLELRDDFQSRHLGPNPGEIAAMLAAIGAPSMDALMDQTVPAAIRLPSPLDLPAGKPEHEALAELKAIAAKNVVKRSLIGLGYYDTLTPGVILRNVMENPGWYTAYTPYQAEIAQGRLEALLNYQQMVIDLTGLELANASLLDEATAAAEAMAMARRVSRAKSQAFFVDEACFPQTLDVVKTRAAWFGFELVVGPAEKAAEPEVFGALLQYPNERGEVTDLSATIAALKTKGARGKPALRLPLQTREQHIRREKANSNLRTSPVLLANMAGMYAVYHGPLRLQAIAGRIHRLAAIFASALEEAGFPVATKAFFDTVQVEAGPRTESIYAATQAAGYNLRKVSNAVLGAAFDETSTLEDVRAVLAAFGITADLAALGAKIAAGGGAIPEGLRRASPILSHPVFNTHHTEHEMLRYLKKLQNRDLALDHSMISLGSCTMKLNATSEMVPVTWREFGGIHPFAPREQAAGYLEMIDGLAAYLKAVTGFDAICMQPNSGAQGEYAGLVAIRRYHASRGEGHRDVCLIPKSAHGTNPATAQMCGLEVVVVACDDQGNVDVDDLAAKARQHAARLACLMITYPSTHGVFEEAVREICDIVHAQGGQVYMDGANLNAQVGLTAPAFIGADVSHMNLHKTFCIPHGGGGPGMGPIGLKARSE